LTDRDSVAGADIGDEGRRIGELRRKLRGDQQTIAVEDGNAAGLVEIREKSLLRRAQRRFREIRKVRIGADAVSDLRELRVRLEAQDALRNDLGRGSPLTRGAYGNLIDTCKLILRGIETHVNAPKIMRLVHIMISNSVYFFICKK